MNDSGTNLQLRRVTILKIGAMIAMSDEFVGYVVYSCAKFGKRDDSVD
jgi:hypothetical protein